MGAREDARSAPRRGHRVSRNVVQSLSLVLFGLLLSQYAYLKTMFVLVTQSAQDVLPDWYIRPAADMHCTPIESEFVEDAYAYLRDPLTGRPAQTTQSCEDVRLVPSHGIAFLSCDPGRIKWNTFMGPLAHPEYHGALWLLHYDRPSAPHPLPIDGFPAEADFHPLGLGVQVDEAEHVRLFVLNQRGIATTVEVLDVHNVDGAWRATYVRTVAHPLATHMGNSVKPLSRTSMLITNTHVVALRAPPKAWYKRTLEGRLGSTWASYVYPWLMHPRWQRIFQRLDEIVGLGWVAHVTFTEERTSDDLPGWEQGVTTRAIASNIAFANGIEVTPTHSAMVVAATVGPGVLVYPIKAHMADGTPNWTSPSLFEERVFVPMPFFPDNMDVMPATGTPADHDPLQGASILVAGHPSLRDLTRMIHEREAAPLAPSWVAEIAYTGRPRIEKDDEGVPVPTQQRSMPPPPGWRVRTWLQTNGRGGVVNGQALTLSASTGIGCDPARHTCIMTGLYWPTPIECRGMEYR